MSALFGVLTAVLTILLVLLIGRVVISYAMLFGVRARGALAALFELVYLGTDWMIRPLDRVLPTLRFGRMAISLSFPVLFIGISVALSYTSRG